MSIVQALLDFVCLLLGFCPEGGKHCEHYDYRSGAVTFFRCCKCKYRSSMHVDYFEPRL